MKIYVKESGGGPLILPDAEAAPVGYIESTTITNFDRFGEACGLDFKKVRSEIAGLAAAAGFANLTEFEKKLASRYVAVVKTDRDTVHTQAQQDSFNLEYHKKSIETRRDRLRRAESYAFGRLNDADRLVIVNDLNATNLSFSYREFGLEGISTGDTSSGLYDYVEATNDFASGESVVGIASKAITPLDGTLAELVTKIMEFLKGDA